MNREQFVQATGVSIRQLDYWTINGIPLTTDNKAKVGSGYNRDYDPETIEKVKLLVAVSRSFEGTDRFSVYTLKRIFEEYDSGQIKIAEGLYLKWDIHKGDK